MGQENILKCILVLGIFSIGNQIFLFCSAVVLCSYSGATMLTDCKCKKRNVKRLTLTLDQMNESTPNTYSLHNYLSDSYYI